MKDLKSTLSRYLNKRSKNCLNQGSKKVSNKTSWRKLIYASLLEASKTCDLSLIKKKEMFNSTKSRSGYPKLVKLARVSF